MTFTIRAVAKEDEAQYIQTMFWSAGRPVDDAFIEEQKASFEMARSFAAFDGSDLIGTVGARSLRMSLPGGCQLPFAAIGQGGVLPSHTRRGAMRQLMMRAFRDAVEHDEALAGWTTSEWPLYERYGGGPATFGATYLMRDVRQLSLDAELGQACRVCLVDSEVVLAALPELHARTSQVPGGVARDHSYWQRVVTRLDQGKSLDVLVAGANSPPAMYCLCERDGVVVGAALYRIHQEWQAGLFRSRLELLYLLHEGSEAMHALWRFLLGLDLIDSVLVAHAPLHEPLRWMLSDGRRLETLSVTDHVWLRLLDPVRVLGQRSFPRLAVALRIAFNDPLKLVANATLQIESDGASTNVEITRDSPDVEMSIGVLSSLVLDGVSVWDLIAADRIKVHTSDARSKLATAFSASRPPFSDNSF